MTTKTRPKPRTAALVLCAGYVAVIALGAALLPKHPSVVEALPVALASIAFAGLALAWPAKVILRQTDDIQRHLLVESTAVAFYVTMVSVLTWGICESWLGAPRVSAWWAYGIGMVSFFLFDRVKRRRTTGER